MFWAIVLLENGLEMRYKRRREEDELMDAVNQGVQVVLWLGVYLLVIKGG